MFDALWSIMASISGYGIILIDADIMKHFCSLSQYVTEKMINYLQGFVVFLFFLGTSGFYAKLGSLGNPTPPFVFILSSIVSSAAAIIITIIHLLQLLFLVKVSYGEMIHLRKEMDKTTGHTARKYERYNFFWVFFATEFAVMIVYLIVFVLERMQLGGSPNWIVLRVTLGNTFPFLSTMVLLKIRETKMNLTPIDKLTMSVSVTDDKILKSFCIFSSFLSPERITGFQILVVNVYLVGNLGSWIRLAFLGRPSPEYITAWIDYCMPGTYILLNTIRFAQAIYLMRLTSWESIKLKRERQALKNKTRDTKDLGFFYCLFGVDLVLELTIVGLWAFSRDQKGSGPNVAVSINTLGALVPIFSAIVLYKMKSVHNDKRDTFQIDSIMVEIEAMEESAMGKYSDGITFYSVPDFTNPVDYLAVLSLSIVTVLHLIGTVILLRMYLRKVPVARHLLPVFAAHLVTDILTFVYFYSDSPPIINVLFGTFSFMSTTMSVLIDAEILYFFATFEGSVSQRTVRSIQLVIFFFFFLGSFGMYVRFGYLGVPVPGWVDFFILWVGPVYLIVLMIYRFVQALYLMYLTWGQRAIEKQRNRKGKSSRFAYFWILFSIDVIFQILFLLSWLPQITEKRGDSPNVHIFCCVLGSTLPIFTALILNKSRTEEKDTTELSEQVSYTHNITFKGESRDFHLT
ncbi:hypothetical protein EDD86DRAFT_273262 [Gorgonomyces haynaldii]|nr:hypothetical protein EDD86DRAFT_273262 [Gorgonomyces haynaldii]